MADSLLALQLEGENIRISGYITKPSMLKSGRSWQTYIVNSRIIQNRAIAKAVDNAYKSLIPKSGFPLAVLDIEVPQRTIDVNVHPQKSEMKFEDESLEIRAVYKAVLEAIRPASDRALGEIAAVVEKPKVHYEMEPMRFVPASQPADTVPPARPEASGMPAERPAPGTIYETVHRLSGETASMSFAEAQAARQNERQIHYSADVHTHQVADPAEPVMKQHPD